MCSYNNFTFTENTEHLNHKDENQFLTFIKVNVDQKCILENELVTEIGIKMLLLSLYTVVFFQVPIPACLIER